MMPVHLDTILCEAIRPEANGKVSLLGVFGEGIFVPQIPSVLGSLGVFQRWRPTAREPAGTRMRIAAELRGPGVPRPLAIPESEAIVPSGPYPLIQLVFQVQGFPVRQNGDYEIRTYINGVESNLYRFSINIPTEEQRRALNLQGFGPL
jgi:hypothetical protein